MTGDCFVERNILTLDGSRPEAAAVAIQAWRITYVGAACEAQRNAGTRAEIIDLAGRVAFPGFIESHTHPVLLGRYLEEVDCWNCSSIEEIVEGLRIRAKVTPPGEWVVGNGYDHTLLKESRHPTRCEFDRVSDEHPVLLRNIIVHNVVANAEALRLAGSTTLRPTRRAAGLGVTRTGSPTACCGSGRKVAVQSHLPEASIQDIARQLEKAAEEYLSAGVTSVVDAALGLANGMQDAEA